MKLMTALRDYLNKGNDRPVDLAELKTIMPLSDEDRADYKRELTEDHGYVIED